MSVHVLRGPAVRSITGYQIQAAGHGWDAVRVHAPIARPVLLALGDRSGAVIEDPREPALYWFVVPGATAGWNVPGTRPLGLHQHLVVPDRCRRQGPGPWWRIHPERGALLTDAGALLQALHMAAGTCVSDEALL
jgi:hypothetical protein